MDIPRFKANDLHQGKESVVGNCNGHSCEERFRDETPIFARAILRHLPKDAYTVLDYGCGIGRLAKEVLKQNPKITVYGVDASDDELRLAKEYVNDSRFIPIRPENIPQKVDLIYCIYVLQHVPAIELRHAIERMHYFLKPEGKLVYCSSDYRMAINSGGGFTDDQNLGVNIRRELKRLFEEESEMFDSGEMKNKLIKDMVTAEGCPPGSIPHPAKIYKKREIVENKPYFMVGFHVETGVQATKSVPANPSVVQANQSSPRRLILQNRLSPGDILVMTSSIRSLHKAYPGRFLTDVETHCMDIFENNPYITKLSGDGDRIDMHYPLISDHQYLGHHHPGAGISGRHFSDGHRKFLEEVLEIEIPRTGITPDLFLSQDERLWPSPVLKEHGLDGKYWILNAGSKGDYTLKQYHRYQEVVDLLLKKWGESMKIVQIGALEHNHTSLAGVLDMRGKTTHRELYRTIFHGEGVITCVSYPMHVAAALNKPCVVVAGGRESARWEYYPSHRYLVTNGALPCCAYDGCWKSKLEDCVNQVRICFKHWPALEGVSEANAQFGQEINVPRCMEMIRPEDIVRAVELYYEGGVLQFERDFVNV